jgi:hypothetical protein
MYYIAHASHRFFAANISILVAVTLHAAAIWFRGAQELVFNSKLSHRPPKGA